MKLSSSGLHTLLRGGLLLALTLLAVACSGRGEDTDRQALVAETTQIALAYAQDQDLALAQQRLEALDVANGEQWLVYVTETALDQPSSTGVSQEEINALVRLTAALGLETQTILDQAIQLNLRGAVSQAAAPPPTPTPAGMPAAQPTQPPTATAAAPVPTPAEPATATPAPQPEGAAVTATTTMNVRGGPGTAYPVVGSIAEGEQVPVAAKNESGDWWQIDLRDGSQGWVFGQLVTPRGDMGSVVVAANIPAPPPTNTPAPTAAPAAPTAPAPAPGGPDFRLVEHRLWNVEENGGFLAGGRSVNCGEKHELYVVVLDANGNRLDGVTVGSIYTNEEQVTGVKGPGVAEFVLYPPGNDVRIKRDADGREVTSDTAVAPVDPRAISHDILIGGRFCTDAADCERFASLPGCFGHYSWTATYQRSY